MTTLLTTSCGYNYTSDICANKLRVVKIKNPETQPRKQREDLAYNNRIIGAKKCGN